MSATRLALLPSTIRPHQALGDRTPTVIYTGRDPQKTAR